MQGKKIQLPGDAVAAVTEGIASIPDGMASGIMAGVNPIYGLYSAIIGPLIGAWTTSSVFMTVTTTSALALAADSAVNEAGSVNKIASISMITVLAGMIQLVFSFFNAGYLLRFVSNSVMRGFLMGIAVLIIVGQTPDFTGNYEGHFDNKVLNTFSILSNPASWNWWIIGTSSLTLLIILALRRTRLTIFSMFLAMIIATLIIWIFKINSVLLVGEEFPIPDTMPPFILPDYTKIRNLILPSLAVAWIGFIQGAGVSQIKPNPDENYPDESGDLRGQGLSNVAAGLFSGIPVGGSLASTSVLSAAGAKSRWAKFFAGVVVASVVFSLSDLIEQIPLACFAAILAISGFDSINKREILLIWNTSNQSKGIMTFTFFATLALTIQQAVLLSIGLTFILYVVRSSNKLKIKSIDLVNDVFQEKPLPQKLESKKITTILSYGSLFFAGAFVLNKLLPEVNEAKNPVVIFVLRGKEEVGSTFIGVMRKYNQELIERNGKLILTGVSENVFHQLERTGFINEIGKENIYRPSIIFGDQLRMAWKEAEQWIQSRTS
jgi:SulP family sulfate permease